MSNTSTEISVQEGDKSIAEFMGAVILSEPIGHSKRDVAFPNIIGGLRIHNADDLKYHSYWDWLMPVVEKVESIETDFDGYFQVHISSNGCTISGTRLNTSIENPHYAYFNDVVHESKISATWLAIVQFLQWYNTQTKQTHE